LFVEPTLFPIPSINLDIPTTIRIATSVKTIGFNILFDGNFINLFAVFAGLMYEGVVLLRSKLLKEVSNKIDLFKNLTSSSINSMEVFLAVVLANLEYLIIDFFLFTKNFFMSSTGMLFIAEEKVS